MPFGQIVVQFCQWSSSPCAHGDCYWRTPAPAPATLPFCRPWLPLQRRRASAHDVEVAQFLKAGRHAVDGVLLDHLVHHGLHDVLADVRGERLPVPPALHGGSRRRGEWGEGGRKGRGGRLTMGGV